MVFVSSLMAEKITRKEKNNMMLEKYFNKVQ